ncbi:STAS domain-containing protein [Streptomyces erythrochromogenes]|uniref:STAS domain-containing protein n=1 Tax=Streptomyces erythrochromogenes TaxID=285574 RepID=UPI003679B2B0
MLSPEEFRTDMSATVVEAVVCVTGEIDLETSPVLHLTLLEALAGHPRHLEVDFTHVTFCDCSGLSILLRARAAAQAAGSSFTLVHVDAPSVIRLLDLTGTGPLLGLAPGSKPARTGPVFPAQPQHDGSPQRIDRTRSRPAGTRTAPDRSRHPLS